MRWTFAIAALAGCTLQAPKPEIRSVSPEKGWRGEPTDVEIVGKYFYPNIVVDPREEGGGTVDGAFAAWLVGDDGTEHELDAVVHLAYDTVRAEVPEDLPTGLYDLRLRTPSGLEDTHEDAFTVTATRADRLALFVQTTLFEVPYPADVQLFLLDNADVQVEDQVVRVRVEVSSTDGLDGVSLVPFGALDDEQLTDDGHVLTGTLKATGEGRFFVEVTEPRDLTVSVEAVDPEEPITGDSQILTWTTGPVAEVRVDLPRDDFRTFAGEPFEVAFTLLDAEGNEIEDQSLNVFVYDECDSLDPYGVGLVGGGSETVSLTKACAENRIYATAGDEVWSSETFEVLPGPAAAYLVEPVPTSVVAGEVELLLDITAVDVYGNTVADYPSTVNLVDDIGGLDPIHGIGSARCPGFPAAGPAEQACAVALWTAGPEVHVTASDQLGVSGTSPAIEVVPNEPSVVLLSTSVAEAVAGEPFDLAVRVLDAYGNSVQWDPGGTDPWDFTDDTGTIACDWTGELDGAQTFACTVTVAADGDGVSVRALELRGSLPDPLPVVNGPLARVEVAPVGGAVVAGTPFVLEAVGYDAYDNPYLVQTDPDLDLSDTTGTLTPGGLTLGPTGEATVSAAITRASVAVVVTASQGGVDLGESAPFVVVSASLDSLDVDAPAWISVGDGATVVVTGVDAYGNAVPAFDGPVTLSTRDGACADVVSADFVDGVAEIDVACASPGLAEVFEATDGAGTEGSSGVVDVVDFACASGPAASLLLDGGDEAVACLTAGEATIDADGSGSLAGSAGLVLFHFDDGVSHARTLSDTSTLEFDAAGVREVELVVVDADACADVATAYAYVGEDDGSPAGPVELAVADADVNAGAGTTVTAQAWDCTGDVASGASLAVRADLGDLGATSTGAGLVVTLDALGAATFDWDFGVLHDGTATLAAGTGGAWGTATVDVTGESGLVQVVEMSPAGATSGMVSSIDVELDDAILDYSGLYTAATLTGPDGAVAVDVSFSGSTLTVTPQSPVDAGEAAWVLTLSDALRDASGNRLDGAWSGARGAFTGTFGDVPVTVPDVDACVADTTSFVPDGDDGADVEADGVEIALSAASTPTWWWWRVYDAGGERVRHGRADGATGAIAWDGRGDDGIVVGSGTYTLRVAAVDGSDNAGDPCEVDVEVFQHVEGP
ncbi:MAG: Ig-like domain-containing protein [Myxococcota bacterium]